MKFNKLKALLFEKKAPSSKKDHILGPCLRKSLKAIEKDPTLRLVMGKAGKNEDSSHFWVIDKNNNVIDNHKSAVPDDYDYQGRILDHISIRQQVGLDEI